MHGAFIATYRTVEFEDKRNAFVWLVVASGVVFLVTAVALVPWLGTYGAVAATAISPAAGAALMIALAKRQGDTTRLPFGPLALAILAAFICLAIGLAAGALPEPWSFVGRVVALVLFPAVLLLVRAVPHDHLVSVFAIAREFARTGRGGLAERVSELPADDAALLAALVRDRKDPAELGDAPSVHERFVAVLASVAEMSRTQFPPEVGEYLLWKGSVSERDRKGLQLWSQDVNPLDVDRLAMTLGSLRALPASAWRGMPDAAIPAVLPGATGDPVLP
jgi:hypothetical protein